MALKFQGNFSARNVSLAYLLVVAICSTLSIPVRADGGFNGGGGDVSEIGVDEIRSDILNWIAAGGAKNLRFPAGIDSKTYSVAMTKYLAPHFVVVSFITTAQDAAAKDPEQKVMVGGEAKACRGFVSSKDHLPHILCNSDRYPTGGADQYRLIHHEFAGLAGVEKNVGASSDYQLSEQITDYLEPEIRVRLSVKKKIDQVDSDSAPAAIGSKVTCMDNHIDLASRAVTRDLLQGIVALFRKKGIALDLEKSTFSLDGAEVDFGTEGVYGYFSISEGTLISRDGTEFTAAYKQMAFIEQDATNLYLKPVLKSQGFDHEGNAINPHCTLVSDEVRVMDRADYISVTNSSTGRVIGRVNLPPKISLY